MQETQDPVNLKCPRVPCCSTDIPGLKEDLMEFAKANQTSVAIPYMTKEYATQYYQQNLKDKPKDVTIHVDFVSDHCFSWSRADKRVSKEQFQCKFTFSTTTVSITHQPQSTQMKYKLSFLFQSVMGMKISSDSIELDLSAKPTTEAKSSEHQTSKSGSGKFAPYYERQIDDNLKSYRLVINVNSQGRKALSEFLDKVPSINCLQRALSSGLQEIYPEFDPCEENPHELFPIARDPTLVRAAQLAILELQCEKDPLVVIRLYDGLVRRFQKLLRLRLRSLAVQHEQ